MRPHLKRSLIALTSAFAVAPAVLAAPIATLDRNGAWVSIEAYGPNVVHVTIAPTRPKSLKGPGLRHPAEERRQRGLPHTAAARRRHLLLERHDPARQRRRRRRARRARAKSISRRNWRPSACRCCNAQGELVLDMSGWELSPHTVNTEKTYQVGASFAAPARRTLTTAWARTRNRWTARPARPRARLQALVRRAGGRERLRALHGVIQGLRHRLG
jgi:alpha-D-xyloside xylohydrolase